MHNKDFKLTMKSNVSQVMAEVVVLVTDKVNPCIVNPLIRLWKMINVFHLLSHVATLALGSRPKQGLAKVQANSELGSHISCSRECMIV
jgi:hypothetical protein